MKVNLSHRHRLARCSFVALGTPLGIASVALLILNDQVLKQIAPSPITDKLSDFAGLFFAPYVLILALGSLPFRLNRRDEVRIAAAAYIVVATFFVALKVSSLTAGMIVSVLAAILPLPISMVVDPTDLIALAVLPASLLIWLRAWSGDAAQGPRVRHAAIASFAVFALIATSQAQPWVISAAGDATDPDMMYAVLSYTVADGLYKTSDDGRIWTRISTVTGVLAADPARHGRLYMLSGDHWDPRVLRLDEGAHEASDIGPPSPGKRPQAILTYGPNILLIAPWSADLVLLSKNGDLWRTADGGAIWQSYGFVGSVQALTYASDQRVIYLATEHSLLRSDDGGHRWTDVAELPGKPAAIAASASGDVLLAAIGKELFRTIDGGKTWQSVLHYSDPGEGNWSWQLVFDPRDQSRAYLLYGSGCCTAMFSVNGGATWKVWGQPIERMMIGATREHPLIAIDARLRTVLRHDGEVPGTWTDVGTGLPVRR
jgi:photosystem II stability/assembly factor-like uncharacterized protein